jgi:predicted RNA-binding protein Jag
MVDFLRLQNIIREQLEQDRAMRSVEVDAPTLEAAITEAATLLDVPVRRLEYEVTEKGSAGFLGTGKKNWKIRAYERLFVEKKKHLNDIFSDEAAAPG